MARWGWLSWRIIRARLHHRQPPGEKLEAQGLACKQPNRHDRRISEVTLSASGQQMIDSIAVARRRLMNQVLAQWPEDEVQALFRLTRKYADSLQKTSPPGAMPGG